MKELIIKNGQMTLVGGRVKKRKSEVGRTITSRLRKELGVSPTRTVKVGSRADSRDVELLRDVAKVLREYQDTATTAGFLKSKLNELQVKYGCTGLDDVHLLDLADKIIASEDIINAWIAKNDGKPYTEAEFEATLGKLAPLMRQFQSMVKWNVGARVGGAPSDQLAKGIEVEREHEATIKKAIVDAILSWSKKKGSLGTLMLDDILNETFKSIAQDHLREIPGSSRYYDVLELAERFNKLVSNDPNADRILAELCTYITNAEAKRREPSASEKWDKLSKYDVRNRPTDSTIGKEASVVHYTTNDEINSALAELSSALSVAFESAVKVGDYQTKIYPKPLAFRTAAESLNKHTGLFDRDSHIPIWSFDPKVDHITEIVKFENGEWLIKLQKGAFLVVVPVSTKSKPKSTISSTINTDDGDEIITVTGTRSL